MIKTNEITSLIDRKGYTLPIKLDGKILSQIAQKSSTIEEGASSVIGTSMALAKEAIFKAKALDYNA